jgi:hypothetical protein
MGFESYRRSPTCVGILQAPIHTSPERSRTLCEEGSKLLRTNQLIKIELSEYKEDKVVNIITAAVRIRQAADYGKPKEDLYARVALAHHKRYFKHFDEYSSLQSQACVLTQKNGVEGHWSCSCKQFAKTFACPESVAMDHESGILITMIVITINFIRITIFDIVNNFSR